MLKIHIPGSELYDEENGVVIPTKPIRVMLEHSLISVSRWETIWEKPFLVPNPKDDEESKSYIRCMLLREVPNWVVDTLFYKYGRDIQEYIHAEKSATIVTRHKKTDKPDTGRYVTSEQIYSWMVEFGIEFEAQKWPLQRLLKLIDIRNMQRKDEKLSPKEALQQRHAINQARRAAANAR